MFWQPQRRRGLLGTKKQRLLAAGQGGREGSSVTPHKFDDIPPYLSGDATGLEFRTESSRGDERPPRSQTKTMGTKKMMSASPHPHRDRQTTFASADLMQQAQLNTETGR